MEVARWAIDCVQDTQSLCPNSTAKSLLQAALWLPPPALPSALAEVVMEVAWAAQGRDEVMENIIIAEGTLLLSAVAHAFIQSAIVQIRVGRRCSCDSTSHSVGRSAGRQRPATGVNTCPALRRGRHPASMSVLLYLSRGDLVRAALLCVAAASPTAVVGNRAHCWHARRNHSVASVQSRRPPGLVPLCGRVCCRTQNLST